MARLMANYQFVNHSSFTIQVPDQNGRMITFSKGQKRILDEWFKKYTPRHLTIIKAVSEQQHRVHGNGVRSVTIKSNKSHNVQHIAPIKPVQRHVTQTNVTARRVGGTNLVGRAGHLGARATEFSSAKVKENEITISNNIGVGILSYNRLPALMHLISSIRKYTDLTRTTIFVSDESTDLKVWEWLKEQKDVVSIHNERIGIAGNTNRLLRCLERFKYKLLLNDDVEILKVGWDEFYFNAMVNTGYKHFCYRQSGVYGAVRPNPVNGVITVKDKPHGAVMAIHHDAFLKVGYFDEAFGVYGFEHVDFSERVSNSGLQPNGFHDAPMSDLYFKIHPDESSDERKSVHFAQARDIYEKLKHDKTRIYIKASDRVKVPSITYVVPYRDLSRAACLSTVISNIRAQKYPSIQIIIAEQDESKKVDLNGIPCVLHEFVKSAHGTQFCKSSAFNAGVFRSTNNKIILHDADMIVRADYTSIVAKLMDTYEAVHIGSTVCYMDKPTTDDITTRFKLEPDKITSERVVTYYEGGSLAINRDAYFKIGGFAEEFVGYGCEDCEFFARLKLLNFMNERSIDLIHLWHGRTAGWEVCHDKNKKVHARMAAMGTGDLVRELTEKLQARYNTWKNKT